MHAWAELLSGLQKWLRQLGGQVMLSALGMPGWGEQVAGLEVTGLPLGQQPAVCS